MSLLDWFWPNRKPKEPEPPTATVVISLSRRGLWRWKLVTEDGKTLALMVGYGHKRFTDCVEDAQRLVVSRIVIAPPETPEEV